MARILHLGKFYPPDNGGIESVTASLARGAARAGHSVTVHCFEEHAKGDAIDEGVRIHRVPQLIKLASQPLGFRYFWRGWLLALKADVIHVHAPNMLGALLTLFVPKRVKIIIHWHSDVVGKGLVGRLFSPLEGAMLQRSDRVICTSQSYADASKVVQPFIGKVSVVPLGVQDSRSLSSEDLGGLSEQSIPNKLRGHMKGRPVVLCVGRLVPYKGYSTLIDAAKLMHTDAAIIIVGGGPLADGLQKKINELDLNNRVVLTGRVASNTLAALQSGATVYCMPSNERSEAFGVALLEAMVWSLPLVATQIPGSGVPWVNLHGQSGLNVRPGDASALAEALDKLLTDTDLREKFALGARARFEALFTEQRFVDATLSVYQDIMKLKS
jgi:glycosyltransferase involved in cell wall biosynthesis